MEVQHDYMEIHEILRKIRRDRDLTQENLADELKVDTTTYNRYEKKDSQIRYSQLEQLATFYGLTILELLEYGDEDSDVSDSMPRYSKKKEVSVTVLLDGTPSTLNYWVDTLKKFNTALSGGKSNGK